MYKTVVLNILAFVLFAQKVRANQDWNGSSEWPHLCHAGQRQSPINISISGDSVEKLSRFTLQFFNFSIPVSKVRVRNTNYYIKIDLQEPPRFVLFQHELSPSQKTLFRLHELNFHWGNQRHNGTEHAFWGRRFDLEGQLMFFNTSYVSYDEAHDKSDGILAVAIYFEISDYSISNIPLHEVASLVQEPHSSQMYNGLLDLRMLIPTIGKYTFYKGSLTTPPCSESVTWVVMINRITISPKAIPPHILVEKSANSDSGIQVGGLIGEKITDLLKRCVANKFNMTLTWTKSGLLGTSRNDTYDGLFGLFQVRQIDFCPFPYTMQGPDDIITFSAVTNTVLGRAVYAPITKIENHDVIESLKNFGWMTYLLIMLATFCVTSTVSGFKCKRFLDLSFRFLVLILNQVLSTPRFYLCLTLLLTSTLVTLVFQQAVNAELVSKDYSGIIDTLDDLVRLSYVRPCFIQDEPFVKFFSSPTSWKYQKVWERAVKMGEGEHMYPMDPSALSRVDFKKHPTTLIASEHIAKLIGDLDCYMRRPKIWLSRQNFGEIPFTFYIRRGLPVELESIIMRHGYSQGESGIVIQLWHYASENGAKFMSDGKLADCIKDRMDDLFPSHLVGKIQFINVKLTFSALIALYLLGFIACFIENQMIGIQLLRHIEPVQEQ